MKSSKIILIGSLVCVEKTVAIRMQLESSTQVESQSEVVVDAESGAEVLNESFLEIEAEQELKNI